MNRIFVVFSIGHSNKNTINIFLLQLFELQVEYIQSARWQEGLFIVDSAT